MNVLTIKFVFSFGVFVGHKSTGYRITELYTAHSPDYLEKAVEAIDVFFGQLACELRVNSLEDIIHPLEKPL